MECFEPWKTVIARVNIADQYDMAAWAQEVFTLYTMTDGEDDSQACLDPSLFPITLAMREETITPLVKQYCLEQFDTRMEKFYVETNGKWFPPGTGLYPHYHPGSVLSAICYPQDSQDGMTMFDPKGNACRGYPKPIRHHHFKNFQISPRAGDIFIFPSYVQHSVAHVAEEVRLSLLHEYYMTNEL